MDISKRGIIRCTPSKFQLNAQPLALYKDGFCYSLGSQGPCRRQPFQLFGYYDVFQRDNLCVNVTSSDLSYFLSKQEEMLIDDIFEPKFDDERIFLVTDTQKLVGKRNWNATSIRRQESITSGIFQLPTRLPTSLLNPCQPGARNGENYKCTNPLV